MLSVLLQTGFRDFRESRREFRLLHDGQMTITLVCRIGLYLAGTHNSRQLFASVRPERIIVDSDGERREMPVPGTADAGVSGGVRAGGVR